MNETVALGSAAAGYKFEFRPDGVYLTVYPAPERQFELADMRQILRECNVQNYDVALLSRTVREASGRAQKIAAASESFNLADQNNALPADDYAQVVVEISRDKMQATVRYDTRQGSKMPTNEMIQNALADAGVVYGLDSDTIANAHDFKAFVAAHGLEPVNGENAYIDRKFDLGVSGRPVVDEFDKVDYKNLNLFVLAKENQTLAIRIPQTKGTAGMNVLGEVVPAQNGRPCPMPEGKNTKTVGDRLIATLNGQIVDKGSRISIDPKLELKGSVGVSTGDVYFDGAVHIRGDVDSGFKVEATGDIEIKGSVNGALVRGRNVYISGGITGADRAKVYAQGDVRTAFIENGLIEAGNDVYVSDIALHAQIRAGKRLIMDQKHGQITGGHCIAGQELIVKVLGNEAFVVTKVSVGVDPNLQREYQELKTSYKETRRRLTHVTQTLNTLSKIDINKLPPERVASINALTRSQFPLAGQLKRDEKRILEIESKLSEMKNGRIKVSETIYPGVRLSVNSILKSIQTEYKRCTISLNDAGEVEVGPY